MANRQWVVGGSVALRLHSVVSSTAIILAPPAAGSSESETATPSNRRRRRRLCRCGVASRPGPSLSNPMGHSCPNRSYTAQKSTKGVVSFQPRHLLRNFGCCCCYNHFPSQEVGSRAHPDDAPSYTDPSPAAFSAQ